MLARIGRAMREEEEGFTLIELLVVIIIIGILAAIAIPVFLNQRKKGWDAGIKSDLRNAATAEETYLTDAGNYTTDVNALLGMNGSGFRLSTGDYDAVDTKPIVKYLYKADGTTTTTTDSAGTGGYCVEGHSKSGVWFKYDSVNGGLLDGQC